jgi:putative transposase
MINLPPFSHLSSAYQLHHYLCFKTHYLREILVSDNERDVIMTAANAVCDQEGYHILEMNVEPAFVRLLISLTPEQTVSRAVQRLKGNLSRQFSAAFPNCLSQSRMPTLWARGYFARSSGRVNNETIRSYVEQQMSHHGYRGTWIEGMTFTNPAFKSPAFNLAHCLTILQYHLVFVTDSRIPIFDEVIARRLIDYIIAVGNKRGFVLDRITIVPNHLHLIVEAIPSLSMDACALSLVNNTRQWLEKNYWGVLKQAEAWNVWKPSFYVGTTGEFTTAQVRKFLNMR